ncbi:MAG: Ldh family oxidoreductase, partial [Rhodosalinus sp.]
TGQFFLAVDPAAFAGEAFDVAMTRLAQSITAQEGARLPGARRAANRARIETEGVSVPQELLDRIAAA